MNYYNDYYYGGHWPGHSAGEIDQYYGGLEGQNDGHHVGYDSYGQSPYDALGDGCYGSCDGSPSSDYDFSGDASGFGSDTSGFGGDTGYGDESGGGFDGGAGDGGEC